MKITVAPSHEAKPLAILGTFIIMSLISAALLYFFHFKLYPVSFLVVTILWSISALLSVLSKNTKFVYLLPMYLGYILSPIFWLTLSGSLTSVSPSQIIRHAPTYILAYVILVTFLECRTIDLKSVPPKVLRKVFPRTRGNVFYLDTTSDVLTLSAWRTTEDWFFSGYAGKLQKAFVVLWFLSIPFMYLLGKEPGKAKYAILGLFLSGLAIFTQPMLVKMWIYFRLAVMKERGEI